MPKEFTKVQALKEFFGGVKPVTNTELLDCRKKDPEGFDWMAQAAAEALGGVIVLKAGRHA